MIQSQYNLIETGVGDCCAVMWFCFLVWLCLVDVFLLSRGTLVALGTDFFPSSRTQVFLHRWFLWSPSRTIALGPESRTSATSRKEKLRTKRTGPPPCWKSRDTGRRTTAAPSRSLRRSTLTFTTATGSWDRGHTPTPFCWAPEDRLSELWSMGGGWRAVKVDLVWSWTCDRLLWGELCPYGTSSKHWDYMDWRLAATTCLHSCMDNDLILCKWMFVLYTLTALGNQPQALPKRWCVFFFFLCEIYFKAIIIREILKVLFCFYPFIKVES